MQLASVSVRVGLLLLLGSCVAIVNETEAQLKARLIGGYLSTSTRPSTAAAQVSGSCGTNAAAEKVEIQFYVDQFSGINMVDQTWGMDGYLRLWWNDPALRFNDTESDGCVDSLNLNAEERLRIWRPNLYWEQAKLITLPAADGTGAFGELMQVSSDGTVWWSRQVRLTLGCTVSNNLERLPFDTQTCTFLSGPYADPGERVFLTWRAGEPAIENFEGACQAQYAATRMKQESILQDYVTSTWTYAKANVSFTRIPTDFMSNYFVPGALMVGVSYLGFYIDPIATPARVALGMLAMVVVMTNTVALTRLLPPSTTPSWLLRFMTISFYFNVVAMAEQILVSFGNSLFKWQEKQRHELNLNESWMDALKDLATKSPKAFAEAMKEWDLNHDGDGGDGGISKAEFRQGVRDVFGFLAPMPEINRLFDMIDSQKEGFVTYEKLAVTVSSPNFAILMEAVKRQGMKRPDADASKEEAELEGNDVEDEGTPADEERGSIGPIDVPMPAIEKAGKQTALTSSAAATGTGIVLGADGMRGVKPDRADLVGEGFVIHFPGPRSRAMARVYRNRARKTLEKGALWEFKTFVLFPILSRVRHMDILFRLIFPIAYGIFVFVHMAEVNFGRDQYKLLETTPCYRRAVGLDPPL